MLSFYNFFCRSDKKMYRTRYKRHYINRIALRNGVLFCVCTVICYIFWKNVVKVVKTRAVQHTCHIAGVSSPNPEGPSSEV